MMDCGSIISGVISCHGQSLFELITNTVQVNVNRSKSDLVLRACEERKDLWIQYPYRIRRKAKATRKRQGEKT